MGTHRTRFVLTLIASSVIPSFACHRGSPATLAQVRATADLSAKSGTSEPSDAGTPYPIGRWRLASLDERNRTVLWLSHILVRHEHSVQLAPFAFPFDWDIGLPPKRSREQARALAESLATRAAAAPERFGKLVEQYSEDVTTNGLNGSLGGVRATHLDARILDALAVLRPGEVSRVVETQYGYHVLMRRGPPPLTTVAARRVVVGYDRGQSSDLPKRTSGRSRDEAFAIAQEIANTLREDVSAWERVVERYHLSAEPTPPSDIGVWTNQEPGLWPREREQLAGVPVGAVLDPMDSRDGVEVLVREPVPAAHEEYPVQVLRLRYSPEAPPQRSDSQSNTLRQAKELAQSLVKAPERWDALRAQFCCDDPEFWSVGRDAPGLVDSAAGLPPGGIAVTPVDDMPFFVLAKRLDPRLVQRQPTLFEVPSPATVDVRRVALSASGAGAQKVVRSLGDQAAASLQLDPEGARKLKTLHEDLAHSFAKGETRPAREKALDVFDDGVQKLLTIEQASQYREFVAQMLSARIMSEPQ